MAFLSFGLLSGIHTVDLWLTIIKLEYLYFCESSNSPIFLERHVHVYMNLETYVATAAVAENRKSVRRENVSDGAYAVYLLQIYACFRGEFHVRIHL